MVFLGLLRVLLTGGTGVVVLGFRVFGFLVVGYRPTCPPQTLALNPKP